jgi:hypothetical protein
MEQALIWNMRTCRSDVKGETQVTNTHEGLSTDAEHRGGLLRSSDEVSVMEMERRQRLARFQLFGQPATG